ncbi:hypothetical protein [Bradyrhizobium sp. S3.2.12]|uniref:hypothetical protein n=1 Tax=Bradyrhizobium sp. S3.2.12 TaxID=3156387 RepID=UPI003391C803
MTMIDDQVARAHRNNIHRYHILLQTNLLQTNLTEFERQFVERRLSEEQSKLEMLVVGPQTKCTATKQVAQIATCARSPEAVPWIRDIGPPEISAGIGEGRLGLTPCR